MCCFFFFFLFLTFKRVFFFFFFQIAIFIYIYISRVQVSAIENIQGVLIYFSNARKLIKLFKIKISSVLTLFFYDRYFTDVDDVKYVINFDYPSSSEDYIHRIGRTGRKRQTGTAYAFFTSHNMKHAGDLIEVLREAGQNVNPRLSEMAEMAKAGSFSGRSTYPYNSRSRW